MALKTYGSVTYPKRKWILQGRPDTGKTAFLLQMRGRRLIVDADQRYDEYARFDPNAYMLSPKSEDNVDPDRISQILTAEMPRLSDVGTIAVDSLSAILEPSIVETMVAKEKKRIKSMAAGFRDKAITMRQLENAVTKWNRDTVWVTHLFPARDENGDPTVHHVLTTTERERLMRFCNMAIEIGKPSSEDEAHRGQRYAKVLWARVLNFKPVTLWDATGTWQGMPEQIEKAVYGNRNGAEKQEAKR